MFSITSYIIYNIVQLDAYAKTPLRTHC